MAVGVPAGRRFTLLFLALLAGAIGVGYSDSVEIGFLFDDNPGIVKNPAIRSLQNIPSFFTDPYALWIDHDLPDLRPVLLITYAVNYAVSGLQPWSYHVLNLILHLIASALVFVIVRDHVWWPAADRGPGGAARLPAAAAALLFALAPLNSQPVDYVWARSALLCTTLYLGAFLTYLRRRWIPGSALFMLALLTKAIAVTLPVMLLTHDFVYRDRSRHPTVGSYLSDWRRLATPLLLTGSLDAAYIVYRAVVLPPWTAEARHAPWVTPWIWFMSEWPAFLHYVRLFLWPDALSVDHDFPITTSLLAPHAWGSLLILLLWLALALLALKRHPQVTFATAWFFVTLAPESSFVALGDQVINDHRPYIATSLGLSVLLVWALHQGAAGSPSPAGRFRWRVSRPPRSCGWLRPPPHVAVGRCAPAVGGRGSHEPEQCPRVGRRRRDPDRAPRGPREGSPLPRARAGARSRRRPRVHELERAGDPRGPPRRGAACRRAGCCTEARPSDHAPLSRPGA